ncbi:MAG: RHS repeat domain-containing protein [Ferruginibacter sp.]
MGCIRLSILDEQYKSCEQKKFAVKNTLTINKTENKVRSSYLYGLMGKEKSDEILGEGNAYDFEARIYNPRLGRFLSVDPLADKQPDKTPYHFVSNNPLNRIDPDGQWDVQVHAYKDRAKSGYALLIVTNNDGVEVYRTVVKAMGTGGRKRNVKNSDTPQGKYKILGYRKTGNGTGYNAVSFGPNDLLALDYQGEEGGSRDGMHVHGGRQEGKYKGRKTLATTHGCMRINDEDIKKLKEVTTQLEKEDPTEKKGKLTLTDDLKAPVVYNADRNKAGTEQFPAITPVAPPAPSMAPLFIVIPIDNTYVAPRPIIPLKSPKKN